MSWRDSTLTAEFTAWPKTPRLFRNTVITEKIDGTNAAVVIEPYFYEEPAPACAAVTTVGHASYIVYAQSRKRIITPDADNYGFARWVWDNAETLIQDLGPGRHFGEWWGLGIQRRYDLDHKRFSLFNTGKWELAEFLTPNLDVVPVLDVYSECDTNRVRRVMDALKEEGSVAAPGFMNPEGVCVYHSASNTVYKVLIENDDIPKGLAA